MTANIGDILPATETSTTDGTLTNGGEPGSKGWVGTTSTLYEMRRILSGFPLSIASGIALWIGLVWAGGMWNVLANTRVLALLIDSGIMRLTDADLGFLQPTGDHDYYLKSQDPIKWGVVAIVAGMFFLYWWLKSVQFHQTIAYHGVRMPFGESVRIFVRGSVYERWMPWGFGEAATAAELEAHSIELRRAHSIAFFSAAFIVFEAVVFGIYALTREGWSIWLRQVFWALILFAIFYLWSRPKKAERARRHSFRRTLLEQGRALLQRPGRLFGLGALSLLAFGLEDVAVYLAAQAFTGNHVLLNVEFSVLMMGLVGGYVARLVRFTPGGIGQFEWGFAAALYLGGVGLPEAVTIAILDNVLRYSTLGIVALGAQFWPGIRTTFADVCRVLYRESVEPGTVQPGTVQPGMGQLDVGTSAELAHDASDAADVPLVPAPYAPPGWLVWQRSLVVAWIGAGLLLLDRLTILFADLWMLESLGLASVFWTNFRMGAWLFASGLLGFTAVVALPAFLHSLTGRQRIIFTQVGALIGLLAGWLLLGEIHSFLTITGEPFGVTDPVFGHDVGFYVFTLPAFETMAWAVTLASLTLLASSVAAAWVAAANSGLRIARDIPGWLAAVGSPTTQVALVVAGFASAVSVWLTRYQLLWRDNSESALPMGAEYLDVTGLFSTLNYIQLTSFLIVVDDIVLAAMLYMLRRGGRANRWPSGMRQLVITLIAIVVIDFGFAAGVLVRDLTVVRPNEPVIQLPYIQRHLDATRAAYRLDGIETIEFLPNGDDDPLPSLAELLNSPALQNAPLWPPYSSYLEPVLDPQHANRVLQTNGDTMIYGPTLESFRQHQKLRTYYDFMSVAPLRFEVDGQTKVYVSSVRELPLLDPQPWLTWWGQRFLLYTHGFGLVMAPVNEVSAAGGPVFASDSIPVRADRPEFTVENPRIYFGEGSVTMAISNIRDLKEFDFPTNQGRAENVLTENLKVGVAVDSLWKRLVFGWRSGQFFEVVFSGLITPETYLQYYRPPLERLKRIAPFVYYDSNIYAVPAGKEIVWLVNGLTTSDRYPYSLREILGDKSVSRSSTPIEMRQVNYVEDSLKITVSAADGSVRFYQIADDPIVNTWAQIYPGLFIDATADMAQDIPADGTGVIPAEVRRQLTYPLQWFHTQFDDIYNYYQMGEAVYFFNMEDLWDDGDEVLGPIMDEGRAITFSIEPYHMLLETGGILPESRSASGDGSQFSLMAVFTPEKSLNLRAIPIAYQDGADYGRLIVLQVPKGTFVLGPEQADSAIDQDPYISQQIALWNRQGTEVVRGHTSLMIVDNELLYVEPIFIRSRQNPGTQLKQVVVVLRGKPYMADTLEEAVRMALDGRGGGTLAAGR